MKHYCLQHSNSAAAEAQSNACIIFITDYTKSLKLKGAFVQAQGEEEQMQNAKPDNHPGRFPTEQMLSLS